MADSVPAPRRDLFGDIAVAKGFLSWAKVRDVLRRQLQYKQMGINMRVGEIAVEMNVLTAAQRNEILEEQTRRRKASQPARPSGSFPVEESSPDGEVYQFGRFRLEKRLGGVMGAVYLGVDSQSGAKVALKVLPRHLAFDTSLVERFKREVKATGVLSHPNIARVYDAGVEKGVFFLAMEFIEGETLTERLHRDGRVPEPDALKIARDIARALAHAHSHHVLHRDVKPDNIMLAKTGEAKLTDFGLAKLLAEHQQITAEGIAVGTPHYIAPEQARALSTTDHRADLYALGATMFHALTGRLPYEGDDGAEVMRRHVFEPTPDPRTVRADISDAAATMLMMLMAKEPGDRYQSAAGLVAFLDGVLNPAAPAPVADAAPVPASSVRTTGSVPRKPFAAD